MRLQDSISFSANKFYGVAGLKTDVDSLPTISSGSSVQFFGDDG